MLDSRRPVLALGWPDSAVVARLLEDGHVCVHLLGGRYSLDR